LKLVVLTSRFPFPLDKGDKLRAYYQIRELSKHFDVYLIALSDHQVSDAEKSELTPYCKSVDIQYIPENKRYINLMTHLFSNMPWQVRYFYDADVARHIDMMIEEINPDHIYVQLIRMAPYVDKASQQKSIDYMDSMSLNMGNTRLSQFKRLPFLNKIERKRCERYERKLFSQFDAHYAISHRDRRAIDALENQEIEVVSNGVDLEFFEFKDRGDTQYQAAFIGNLGYVHNDKAAHYLIDEIMPLMTDDFKVLIAGSRPSEWLNIKQRRNIRVSGYIEDIRDYYKLTKLVVAPIFSGSGQQNKILEAMALGIPCITTSFVNESLGAVPGEEILIADDPKRFSGDMMALQSDTELYNKLSYAGRNMVRERFDWVRVTQPLIAKIKG